MGRDFNKKHVNPKLAEKLTPFDGNVYVTRHLHQAYHHHMKVITTHVDPSYYYFSKHKKNGVKVYQILTQSQLSAYHADDVPEAKFIYDLSPVAVTYKKESKKWYDYLTSLMAIVGGAFIVVGMLESSISVVTSKKMR